MFNSLSICIVKLKNEYIKNYMPNSLVFEIIPAYCSTKLTIEDSFLNKLISFAQSNPIYFSQSEVIVDGILCKSFQGDINYYWLSSKKYDTCYQPFYPTWILSAYALAFEAKKLGFTELIDVGSGDGRIAYCASIVGLKSFSIEIDTELTSLQYKISKLNDVNYEVLNVDATAFEYKSLRLSRPIFFISGLPELGDILAKSVITKVKSISNLEGSIGFNFMGSHKMRDYTSDRTKWGWGNIIEMFDLKVISSITLPTLWTNDQNIDTPYVYTQTR